MNSATTIIPFVLIIFSVAIGVVMLNFHFQKRLLTEKLEQDKLITIHQTELLRSSILAQEEERKRIAQDLHDELGAILSIMRMHLKLLEQSSINSSTNSKENITNILQLSENALTSLRSISHQLMPPQLERYGLIKTIESVVNQINSTKKITIHLNSPDSQTTISWDINLSLYRIIMELINNTIKYANATIIQIDIAYNNYTLSCIYTDNGDGIIKENIDAGLGLKSIEARISALKGKLEFGNRTGVKGFFANLEIPV